MVLTILSFIVFYVTGETAANMETYIRDYANPLYLCMVLTAFFSLFIGLWATLQIYKLAYLKNKQEFHNQLAQELAELEKPFTEIGVTFED